MVLDEVAADEHSCAPQPCLAVNGQRPCIIVTFCSALAKVNSVHSLSRCLCQAPGRATPRSELVPDFEVLMPTPPPNIQQCILADACVTYRCNPLFVSIRNCCLSDQGPAVSQCELLFEASPLKGELAIPGSIWTPATGV